MFLVIIIFSCSVCFAKNEKALWGRDYYGHVKEAIDGADDSIYMVMYLVSLDAHNKNSSVFKLIDSLVKAKERGILVKVILDRDWKRLQKNKRAYDYLRQNGINVLYDEVSKVMHSKALVIDKRKVIVGSTNWTEAALTESNELSLYLENKAIAKEIIKRIDEIKLSRFEKKQEKPPLLIYRWFMEDPSLAGRMMTTSDERAFDVYLFLLKGFDGNKEDEIVVDYEKLADSLGIKEKMSKNAYRRQINKVLRKLEHKYGLIEFNPVWGKEAEVKLLDYFNKDEVYQYPLERYFPVPCEYWQWGWNKQFSFREKYCYFINLYMLSFSQDYPYWQGSTNGLAKMFSVSPWLIKKGMGGIRRLNIIEIEYGELTKEGRAKGDITNYKILGIYSEEEMMKKCQELRDKYGKKNFRLARRFSKVVFKENDPEIVEKMIKLIDEYGETEVKKAVKIVAKKSVQNPKRKFGYIVGIVKRQ